jgi:hypothetical protein
VVGLEASDSLDRLVSEYVDSSDEVEFPSLELDTRLH